MIKTFYDLDIYQRSYKIALDVHKTSKTLPKDEHYVLADQMRRASRSIPSNIAEGFSKHHSSAAEFKRFLAIAVGSCNEMLVWLDFCKDLGYIKAETTEAMKDEYLQISSMIFRLSENWKSLK